MPIVARIIDRIEADARAYVPTPQKARWAEIESRARLLLAAMGDHRRLRLPGKIRNRLAELQTAVEAGGEDDAPLAIIGQGDYRREVRPR